MTPATARLDPMGLTVIIRIDAIRTDTLEALARAWRDDPVAVTDALDELAAALPHTTHPDDPTGAHPAAIREARDALTALTELGPAETDITHDEAVELRNQLDNAIAGTCTARIRKDAA